MNTITVPAEYPVLLPQRSLVKEHLVETAPCVVYFGFYFLCLRQCNPSNKNAFTLITNWLGPEISSITKLLTLQAWGHKFNYQYPKFRKKEKKKLVMMTYASNPCTEKAETERPLGSNLPAESQTRKKLVHQRPKAFKKVDSARGMRPETVLCMRCTCAHSHWSMSTLLCIHMRAHRVVSPEQKHPSKVFSIIFVVFCFCFTRSHYVTSVVLELSM